MQELDLGDAFYSVLCARVVATLKGRYPGQFGYRILMCDFDGGKLVDYVE